MQPHLDRAAATLTAPQSAFVFLADVQLAEQAAEQPQRFSMVANSGKPITSHPFFGTLGINLDGVRYAKRVPVLLDHDTTKRIGVAEELRVGPEGLVARGTFLSNDNARTVVSDSREGFPWQASVYLRATKVRELRESETALVNGHEMTGPGYVFEDSELREVTFTALGADPNTSAVALSGGVASTVTAQLMTSNPMTDKTEVATPPVPVIDEAKLKQDAAAAERARVVRILKACAPEQRDIAHALIERGATTEDALLSINADLQARLSARLGVAMTPSTQPLSTGNREDASAVDAEAAKLAAMPEGEEKWRAAFARDAKLQAEFGNVNVYVAFERNRNRAVQYGITRNN